MIKEIITHATYPVRLPSNPKVSGKIDAYLGQMTWRINANRTFRNMRDGKYLIYSQMVSTN